MLRVIFEIVPFGIEDHPNRRVIGEMRVGLQNVNNGIGEYVSALHSDAKFPPLNKVVRLENDRSTGAWPLVSKALELHCDPEYRTPDDLCLPECEGES